ncbi:MAG: glutamate-5-semialdehyde dehydrogenase [Deltaproteobacteria bacterium]|jgi:glutamate-5-semialdehyde dehydrogenase|nr:glutamate-5-semialdehyde dehydrogenase [Deltaproteobacteria bacterium]
MSLRPLAIKAQESLPSLAASGGAARDGLLLRLADLLDLRAGEVLDANRRDMENGRAAGLPAPLLDRLELSPGRVADLAKGIREVAQLPDPLGAVEDFRELASGLKVGRMRVPLGLIAFICEARPGAVAEAAAMALKSGNALLVKPGKEAKESAAVIGSLIGEALTASGLPAGAVAVLAGTGREGVLELLRMDDLIDLVIPRGGEGLIRYVAENSRIPVLKHFKGVCHLYVDKGADLGMATELAVNGKANRPGTCNALECLLVHQDEAEGLFRLLVPRLVEKKVRVRAHEDSLPKLSGMGDLLEKAVPSDWGKEFLDLVLALKCVASMDEALEHIRLYGSRHTESIATSDLGRATEFLKRADAGCVLVNASTRLNDGGCLGLGAEIGISTTKLQAYGPMGLLELTSRKFVALGNGQLRG